MRANNRPSRHELGLLIAELIAKRSSCQRAQVGCIITKNHRIISSGYNGPLLGKDCNEAFCDVSNKCQHAVHAEANAISAAAREGISLTGCILYCSYSPCYECAKLIIQSGITQVYCLNEYKTEASVKGSELLTQAGIPTMHYKITYETKD